MFTIHNEPHITDDPIANARRGCNETRGSWMALFYLEAKERGIDLEPIMRSAIRKYGRMNGKKERARFPDGVLTARAYGSYFVSRSAPNTFEKEVRKDTEDEFVVDFHYCSLLAAWQSLGLDSETCALLCDIAMEGDRGIAEGLGLDFTLEQTIAQGCETCRLCYRTKK